MRLVIWVAGGGMGFGTIGTVAIVGGLVVGGYLVGRQVTKILEL